MSKPRIVRKEDIKGFMPEEMIVQIPDCCREGHPDCPHVLNKDQPKKRRNIGI